MEDMLAKHKDINAVFCEGDVMCLGAQKAIADAKRTQEISIFGFDGQKAAIEQIMKGTNFVATGVNSAERSPASACSGWRRCSPARKSKRTPSRRWW